MRVTDQQKQDSDDLLKAVKKLIKKNIVHYERYRIDLFRDLIEYGFSSKTIYKWYKGERNLSPRTVKELIQWFEDEDIEIHIK